MATTGTTKNKKTNNSTDGSSANNGSSTASAVSTTYNSVLDTPSEISQDEYNKLVDQIRAVSTANASSSNSSSSSSSTSTQDELFVWTLDACRNELLEGARYDEIDLVRGIIKCHPQLLYYQDPKSGNTALHMAAANGHAQTVELLLSVCSCSTTTAKSSSLIMTANKSGNTPLHWAAANGKQNVVRILVKAEKDDVDVLQKNAFGRSALSEGFQSDNTQVIQALLEHDSATEERLLETSNGGGKVKFEDEDGEEDSEITHTFLFGRCENNKKNDDAGANTTNESTVLIKVRERVMARTDNDTILADGADRPQDDTTGLGIWSSSLVTAQWICDVIATKIIIAALLTQQQNNNQNNATDDTDNDTDDTATTSVLELGAGCGVPSLALQAKLQQQQLQCDEQKMKIHIYATDFNKETVDNLRHNIRINQSSSKADDNQQPGEEEEEELGDNNNNSSSNNSNNKMTAMLMNWQDKTTWPSHKIDYIIGSDLIYQSNMVPLLISVITRLLKRDEHARFWYVAPDAESSSSGGAKRQGHDLFLKSMVDDQQFVIKSAIKAPSLYSTNPLQSQDDEQCFLHFNELQSTSYILYEFAWK